jgi:hypothetical protein
MRNVRLLETLADKIERAQALDSITEAVVSVARKVIKKGPIEDTLSGTPLGHPLHPLLVGMPIGAWVSAAVLDGTGNTTAARRLVGLGCLAALPAAAAGRRGRRPRPARTTGPRRTGPNVGSVSCTRC